MKKTLTLLLCAAACAVAFTGCARNDDVDSNPSSNDSAVIRDDSYNTTNSSKTVPDRVESTVDDVIGGGKRIVDDTASTAKDVVDNFTK